MRTIYAIDPTPENLELALELAAIARPTWARVSAGIPASHPRLEGEGEGGTGEGDAGGTGETDDAGTGDGDTDGDTGDGDTDGDTDDEATRYRKAAAAANAELREHKRQAADRDREAAEKAGKWEDLYKQEKQRADELEERSANEARERLGIAALTELGCRNPTRYLRLLELGEVEDQADALRQARALRKSDPDLFRTARRQARNGGQQEDDDAEDGDEDRNGGRNSGARKVPVNRLRAGIEAAQKQQRSRT